ncbi:hypothetical protein GQ651_04855 [Alphaproteobacteria bacterium GH1-50]|uniref:Uncharacterized protein n=1 Tax=Kangsaoukella pontilimi TaxID=2691042 RepID=A0A7C9IFE0_9RHOB|nr:hypothetical protein [Kangsaoukella pontilimi]MXQ07169.1 hypothetical protein [Kangsaoukella pontilimi]
MSREDARLRQVDIAGYSADSDETVAILAVGSADEWRRQGNRLFGDGRIHFASFEEVTQGLVERLCPTVILSPVLAARFDCIDLAQRLYMLDYTGRYRAVSDDLPDPEMVEREIRHLCPGLDFGILIGR